MSEKDRSKDRVIKDAAYEDYLSESLDQRVQEAKERLFLMLREKRIRCGCLKVWEDDLVESLLRDEDVRMSLSDALYKVKEGHDAT